MSQSDIHTGRHPRWHNNNKEKKTKFYIGTLNSPKIVFSPIPWLPKTMLYTKQELVQPDSETYLFAFVKRRAYGPNDVKWLSLDVGCKQCQGNSQAAVYRKDLIKMLTPTRHRPRTELLYILQLIHATKR